MARRRGAHGSGSAFGGPEPVPVPRLNTGNSSLGRSRGRKPPGKVGKTVGALFMLAIFGLAIAGFVSATVELSYRAGWAGTPGTLSTVSCETVGSGRSESIDCDGFFQAGSRAQPTQVSIEGSNTYPSNHSFPARLHADGQTASVVSGKTVAYILGGVFALLGAVVFMGWFFVLWIVGITIRLRLGRRWQPGKWAALTPLIAGGVLLAFGIISGIVGAALSF